MKIAVTSDITRISERGKPVPSHNTTTLWFKTLLEPVLTNIKDLSISEILSKESVYGTAADAFDTEKLYELCGLELNSQSWAKIYSGKLDAESLDAAEKLIVQKYSEFDLVLGFELSDLMIQTFNKCRIPYIDAFIHPVRFHRDIIIAYRTNRRNVFRTLLENAYFFSYEDIYNNTAFERAKLYMTQGLGLEGNSCLFLGQTNVDKSLIEDGKIKSLFDFKDDFERLGQEYSKVYFKIHPYMAQNSELTDYLSSLDFVEIIDENIYRLFGQKSIEKIYSLSSSGCYEAKFFNKPADWLIKYPFEIVESNADVVFSPLKYIPVKSECLVKQQFWTDLLNVFQENLTNQNLEIHYQYGDIRRSIGKKWGYGFFEE